MIKRIALVFGLFSLGSVQSMQRDCCTRVTKRGVQAICGAFNKAAHTAWDWYTYQPITVAYANRTLIITKKTDGSRVTLTNVTQKEPGKYYIFVRIDNVDHEILFTISDLAALCMLHPSPTRYDFHTNNDTMDIRLVTQEGSQISKIHGYNHEHL